MWPWEITLPLRVDRNATFYCLMDACKIRRNMEPEKMDYRRYPSRETWRIQVWCQQQVWKGYQKYLYLIWRWVSQEEVGNSSLAECKEVVCWYCRVTSKYVFAMKLLGTWLAQTGMWSAIPCVSFIMATFKRKRKVLPKLCLKSNYSYKLLLKLKIVYFYQF